MGNNKRREFMPLIGQTASRGTNKMAALMRHGLLRSTLGITSRNSKTCLVACKNSSGNSSFVPDEREDLPRGRAVDQDATSLSAKGYLRAQKPYDPPSDVRGRLRHICQAVFGQQDTSAADDVKLDNPDLKFKLLNACFEQFQHGIPNSMLYKVETLGDVIGFYETPVNTTVPLDRLKDMQLPPNLHVQYEPHRFHPDTDTMFGGISAFPKSSTIVTGIKYKKKYKGHKAKTSWP